MPQTDPVTISFVVDFDEFNHFSNAMRHRAANMGPWFDVYTRVFQLAEETLFESQGVFGGVGDLWSVPYSKAYSEYKMMMVGHQTKEIFTGDLFRSLTSSARGSVRIEQKSTVAPGAAVLASASIELGTNLPYAELQQYGGSYVAAKQGMSRNTRRSRAGKMITHVPPRPPVLMDLPEQLKDVLGVSIMEYLVDGNLFIPRF